MTIMTDKPTDILFTEASKKVQRQQGSDEFINRLIEREHWKNTLSDEQILFIQNRESFYLGTASADGRPYIQHRGGNKGFINVNSSSSLYFADFGGNKQYITTGNLAENDQAFIFFMDYANRRRLKLWGRAFVHTLDEFPLSEKQSPKRGSVERIIKFDIEAIDENCPQHIQQLFSEEEYDCELIDAKNEIERLQNQIQILQQKCAEL